MCVSIMAKLAVLFVVILLNQHELFQAMQLSSGNERNPNHRLYEADLEHMNRAEQPRVPNYNRRPRFGTPSGSDLLANWPRREEIHDPKENTEENFIYIQSKEGIESAINNQSKMDKINQQSAILQNVVNQTTADTLEPVGNVADQNAIKYVRNAKGDMVDVIGVHNAATIQIGADTSGTNGRTRNLRVLGGDTENDKSKVTKTFIISGLSNRYRYKKGGFNGDIIKFDTTNMQTKMYDKRKSDNYVAINDDRKNDNDHSMFHTIHAGFKERREPRLIGILPYYKYVYVHTILYS